MTLEVYEMRNQYLYTKFDIARWIAIIPVTIAVTGIYYAVIDEWLRNELLPLIANDFFRLIFSIKDAFVLPVIFIAPPYLISPKVKFKSTVISTIIYVLPLVFYIYLTNDYPRPPTTYLWLLLMNYLIGLFVIYRLDRNKHH